MERVGALFQRFPEVALVGAVTLGPVLGQLKLRGFRLGPVGGCFVIALFCARLGVRLDDDVPRVFLPMFTYALGYELAPQVARAFRRAALRELFAAFLVTAAGLVTVLALADLFSREHGIGSASELAGLSLPPFIARVVETARPSDRYLEEVAQLWRRATPYHQATCGMGALGLGAVAARVWTRRSASLRGTAAKEQPRSPVTAAAAPEAGRGAPEAGRGAPEAKKCAGDMDERSHCARNAGVVWLGAGAAVGALLGCVRVELELVTVDLGSGGGALVSGLAFGCGRALRGLPAAKAPAACAALKDLGLSGSLAAIVLSTGQTAWQAVRECRALVLSVALLSALLPLLLSVAYTDYFLRSARSGGEVDMHRGGAAAAATRAWARRSDPHATAYALTSVALLLLGPVLVALR